MVTGAAAILKGARPELSIGEIKQILINTANTDVRQPSVSASVLPDQLAPITRIGGGEVRVDRALVAPAYVRDVTSDEVRHGVRCAEFRLHRCQQRARAHAHVARGQQVGQGAVVQGQAQLPLPGRCGHGRGLRWCCRARRCSVPAGGSVDITAKLTIKGPKLGNNMMSAGSLRQCDRAVTANEYDGYIVFEASDHKLTMPWHVLPRRAAKVSSYQGYAFTPDADRYGELQAHQHGRRCGAVLELRVVGHQPRHSEGQSRRAIAESRPACRRCELVPGTTRNLRHGRRRHPLGVRVQSLGATGRTGGHLPRGGHRHDRRWRHGLPPS